MLRTDCHERRDLASKSIVWNDIFLCKEQFTPSWRRAVAVAQWLSVQIQLVAGRFLFSQFAALVVQFLSTKQRCYMKIILKNTPYRFSFGQNNHFYTN